MGRRGSGGGSGEKGAGSGGAFGAGAEVEVSCDDDGFRGAWYEAVVARPLPSRRRCLITYSSLLSDDDPSRPLQEFVPRAHVRPRPPRTRAKFEVHQSVDAFHNDGWWAGVVAEVHLGIDGETPEGYTVCFPSTRELVEFKPEEVRAHLQWVRGHWIEPEDRGEGEADFHVGDSVEVTRDKESYGAAWFTGKVLKVIRKTIFLVEYDHLVAEYGEHLKEIVDLQFIRPFPPQLVETNCFELQDEVEAFYGDRWLTGIVVKIVSESKYVVSSKYLQEEEIEFDSSNLRTCQHWTQGRWVHTSLVKCRKSQSLCRTKSKVHHKRKLQAGKTSSSPISFSTSSDSDDIATPEGHSDMISNGIKSEKSNLMDQTQSSQPCKKLKKGESSEDHMGLPICSLMKGISRPLVRANVISDAAIESPSLTCEPHNSESHSKESSALCVEVATNSASHPSNGKNEPKFNGVMEPSAGGEEGLELQTQVPNLSDSQSFDGTNDCHLTAGGKTCRVFGSHTSNAPQKRVKKLVIRAPHRQTKGVMTDESEKAEIRKGGKPRKKHYRGKNNILECMESRQLDKRSDSAFETTDGINGFEQSIIVADGASQGICNCESENRRPESSSTQVLDSEGGDTLNVNLEAQQFSNLIMSSVNNRIEEIPDLDECHEAGTAVESQTLPSPVHENTATVCEELALYRCSREVICEKENISVDPSPDRPSTDKTKLPFMRNSPMWESIESMEVFRIMPQQPHFRSLEQYSEEFREGMAIGFMVTFSNMVANLSKLSIIDPQANFEEMLKALVLLEANGFDVQRVRSRIEELLEIKRNQSQSKTNKTASGKKISDLKNEQNRLDAAVLALDKSIWEMEQNLTCFREKRALTIMQGKRNDCEIVKLERDVQAAEEAFLVAESRFATVAASPW